MALLRDDVGEVGESHEVEIFPPKVECSSSDNVLSRYVEPRRDDVEEVDGELYGFEKEVEIFRPKVECSSSDVALSRNVESRRAGADVGVFGAAESSDPAYGNESVESVVWERWDIEVDRGEIGGKPPRGGERERLDVEKKDEIKLPVLLPSTGAVLGRERLVLAARS